LIPFKGFGNDFQYDITFAEDCVTFHYLGNCLNLAVEVSTLLFAQRNHFQSGKDIEAFAKLLSIEHRDMARI